MDFDFSNYAYSGLITIFSTIMGMAYPAVQTAIREIDEKFDSGQIVDFFMTEVSYKSFRFWLVLSIVFALCCPFVLTCCKLYWVHYTWMFFHTIVVLALIASAVKLYNTIMVYYRSGQLVEYIKKRTEDEKIKVSSILADIANFAASKGQKKVYMAAVQAIADQLIKELRLQNYYINPTQYDVENPSTFNSSLSEDMNRCIERLVGILKNRNYDSFFTSDVTIISLFYNIIEQHSLSQGIRDMIWRMVSEITLSNNKEWIMTYWSIADGYARFLKYNKTTGDNQYLENTLEIKEFHAAVGGMLIKYGKTKWLRDILFFTNTQPASYPLLSNTFSDVVDMFDRFEKKLRPPYLWSMQAHYLMKGSQKGVNTDADIVRYIELFLALEFLRLWHIDYNGEYRTPLDTLQQCDSVNDNQRYLDLLERLKWCVEEMFDKNLNNALNFRNPTKIEAKQFLDENIEVFKKKLNDISDNPEIDEDKRKSIIDSVYEAAKEWKKTYDGIVGAKFSEVQHFERTIFHKFPKEYILKHYNESLSSLGTSTVEALKANFSSVFPSFFAKRQATETYRVDYEHIGDALRRLSLSKNYVVISLGFNSSSYFSSHNKSFPEAISSNGVWSFNGAKIYEKWGIGESSLIILHKDNMPWAEMVKRDVYQEADIIADSMPIYSNIKKIDKDTYMNVFFKIFVDVHYPANLQFVRITIPNVFSENKYDLNKVQKIENIIKK